MNKRILTNFAIGVLLGVGLISQSSAQTGQPPSTKGVMIKGKAPVSNEILKVKLPRPQEADLANGIHLMVLEDHRTPEVTAQILMQGAGGYYDPADLPGLAVFTAAMMMEGTAKRTAQQIAQEQETMASSLGVSASMSGETASVSFNCLKENLDKTLNLAADVLLNPSFPQEELARYKARQRASAVQLRSNPSFLVSERLGKVLFGDHPASHIVPGVETIDKATRELIIEFHRAHYVPDETIIAVVGDITFTEVKAKIEGAFGSWKKAQMKAPPVKDPAPIKGAGVYLVDRANSVQTSLIVATQAINRTSPDYDVLSMLNTVVGSGPTGRLFLNLREEKGWTYGAYSNLSAPTYRGSWSAQTEIRGDVTEGAVGEILNEINRVRREPVSDRELQEKKRLLVAGFALSLETPTTILSNYITVRRYGLPADYWDRYPERIMAITQQQIQAAANQYLDPSRIQIIAVGDGKNIGQGLKKFGTVVTYDTEGKLR